MATFRTRPSLVALAIVSFLAPRVVSHGGHEAIPEGEAISSEPMDTTLWVHILLQTLAWGIIFPTGMVLGLVKSRWHVPTQILGTAIAILGYFLGHLHKGRQFAHSAHAGFANWLMLMLIVQIVLGVYLRLHLERGFLGKIRPYQVKAHGILGGVMPVAAWVQMVFGGIASQGFCRDDHVGQCAAHFIMGSAFVGYGIVLTIILLNGQQMLKRSGRSQEFWDSLLISVWGCVNTFTEHRWGGPWVANDLQHSEAWLSVQWVVGTNETLVHQRCDTVQNRRRGIVGAHSLRCLKREARGKHTQPGEQSALGVVEEIVAPGDGRLKRLLTSRRSRTTAHEKVESVVQPLYQLSQSECAEAHRCELDGQRYAVEAPDEFDGVAEVRFGQREVRARLGCTLYEEGNSLGPLGSRERQRHTRLREC